MVDTQTSVCVGESDQRHRVVRLALDGLAEMDDRLLETLLASPVPELSTLHVGRDRLGGDGRLCRRLARELEAKSTRDLVRQLFL